MLPSTSSTPLFHTPPLPKESGNWSRPQSAASRSYPWVCVKLASAHAGKSWL
jgi:hypothetical protein